jgi:hypothetical protein
MTSQVKCPRIGPTCQPTRNRKSSAYAGLLVAGALALATSPTVGATNDLESTLPGLLAGATCAPQPTQTKLTEWDVTPLGDLIPGSVAVDDRSNSKQSKLWFVTRVAELPGDTRVYRLTPGRSFKKEMATATSWPLGADSTGGVRLRHSDDGRFVFVNTDQEAANDGLVAVDTRDNTRVTWLDRPDQVHMSDVSVDTRGGAYSVFTAALVYQDATGTIDGVNGVVQRLRPLQPKFVNNQWVVPADVTRWPVGGGAGSCEDTGVGAPCIPGIVVDRRNGHPIYVSEPDFEFRNSSGVLISRGAIGELDPRPVKCSATDLYNSCAKVRHWPLPAGTTSPRQILLDDHGRLWGIMSSGHLFSLEIDRKYDKATLTRHDPVGPAPEDLFAVAPDGGTIGFTDSENNEVSVLFPKRTLQTVTPVVKLVRPITRRLDGLREPAAYKNHVVDPRTATALGVIYTQDGDGTYVETDVSTGMATSGSEIPSFNPTGMSQDGARKTGSFFYGVTFAGGPNRVGHFEVQIDPDKELEHRKDDDDYDDDGDDDDHDGDDDNDGNPDGTDDDDDNDCIVDSMDKDWDNDGIENEHDSKSHRENKRTDRGTMAPGGAKEYEMESNSNSLLMVAIVEAADLTTPLSIELVDPNGIVVLATPAMLGKAVATATPALPGLYTVRVKNTGLRSATYKTTLVGKSIWY